MFSIDTWKEIFETIQKNKLRTFLSGFTVAIGIFIFVVLYGFGNGLTNTFTKFFGDDATNVFFIFPGRTSVPYAGYKANRRIEFDNSDLEDIEKNFAMFIDYVTPRVFGNGLVKYKNESNNYGTRAVGPAHQYNEKTIMMKGRYLNADDIKNKTKYAVIGRLVEQDLFGVANSMGEYIDVAGSMFKVIGVNHSAANLNSSAHCGISGTSFPKTSALDTTPGKPAPGCVPAPTKNSPRASSLTLCGRNHALCKMRGSIENPQP